MKQLDTRYRVEQGVVVEGPKYMHGAWRNVGNLECLSPEELAALGWLPAWDAESTAGPGEKLTATVLSAEADRVVVSRLKEPLSDAEFNEEIDKQITSVVEARDQTLLGGVLHNGTRWHCDEKFGFHLVGLLYAQEKGILPLNGQVLIRTHDKKEMMLYRDQLLLLAGVVLGRIQQIYGEAWTSTNALERQKRAAL